MDTPSIDAQVAGKSLHADAEAFSYAGTTIALGEVDGWTSKLATMTNSVNGVKTGKTTKLLFLLTGGGKNISVVTTASGTGRRNEPAHQAVQQINDALFQYGADEIAPRLVPRLAQRVAEGGELKVGPLMVRKEGLSTEGFLHHLKYLTWGGYAGSKIANGVVIVSAKKNEAGKLGRFDGVDLSNLNAIVLPPVLGVLHDFLTQ